MHHPDLIVSVALHSIALNPNTAGSRSVPPSIDINGPCRPNSPTTVPFQWRLFHFMSSASPCIQPNCFAAPSRIGFRVITKAM
jgi:hypothetical protein